MSWFMHHAVLFALLCAGAAVVYGLGLTGWLVKPFDPATLLEVVQKVLR